MITTLTLTSILVISATALHIPTTHDHLQARNTTLSERGLEIGEFASTSSVKCPTGSVYAELTDDFTKKNSAKWIYETGSASQVKYTKQGLKMTLDEKNNNIVFSSKTKWVAPSTMTMDVKPAGEPGIISTVIFKKPQASDEIDLEFNEGLWETPIWKNAKRLVADKDVKVELSKDTKQVYPYIYQTPSIKPSSGFKRWVGTWTKDSINWKQGSKQLVKYTRLGSVWPNQALNVRFGIWAAPGDWAGVVDWKKNPSPSMYMKKITIKGCKKV